MTPKGTRTILDSVSGGRYEDALGVPVGADPPAINRAHVMLLHRHRQHPEVREALNRAKGVLGRETRVERARRLLRIGHTEEALAALREGNDDPDDAEETHLIGYTLYQLGRYEEAVGYLEHAAELRRGATDLLWLGNTFERLERWESAAASYEYAVRLRGSAIECHLLGNVLIKLERYDEALPAFERAISLGMLDEELLEKRRAVLRRRGRTRLKGTIQVALAHLRRDPLDYVLMGLALVYGIYFAAVYF
jgi:tetratricopeptide (TPR) repeat protein